MAVPRLVETVANSSCAWLTMQTGSRLQPLMTASASLAPRSIVIV